MPNRPGHETGCHCPRYPRWAPSLSTLLARAFLTTGSEHAPVASQAPLTQSTWGCALMACVLQGASTLFCSLLYSQCLEQCLAPAGPPSVVPECLTPMHPKPKCTRASLRLACIVWQEQGSHAVNSNSHVPGHPPKSSPTSKNTSPCL